MIPLRDCLYQGCACVCGWVSFPCHQSSTPEDFRCKHRVGKDARFGASPLGTMLTGQGTHSLSVILVFEWELSRSSSICVNAAQILLYHAEAAQSWYENTCNCPSVNLPSPFVAWRHHHQNESRIAKQIQISTFNQPAKISEVHRGESEHGQWDHE